jgi:hypothetical protein
MQGFRQLMQSLFLQHMQGEGGGSWQYDNRPRPDCYQQQQRQQQPEQRQQLQQRQQQGQDAPPLNALKLDPRNMTLTRAQRQQLREFLIRDTSAWRQEDLRAKAVAKDPLLSA